MPVSLNTITVLDGNGNSILVQVVDQGGPGPFTWGHALIDGVAGVLRAQVTAANALKVDGSAVTQPVSITGNQAINIVQVAGAAVAQGHGTAAAALRVELPTDGTGIVGLAAGAAIVGKVGIDQTTPVTTNGVVIAPTSAAAAGMTPVVSTALETGHVLKAGAGNLYGVQVTTTTVSGMVLIHNSTTVPGAGAVTPIKAYQVPASSTVVIGFDPPLAFSTGISVSFSTATTPFTQTNSSTAYFSGQVA